MHFCKPASKKLDPKRLMGELKMKVAKNESLFTGKLTCLFFAKIDTKLNEI